MQKNSYLANNFTAKLLTPPEKYARPIAAREILYIARCSALALTADAART